MSNQNGSKDTFLRTKTVIEIIVLLFTGVGLLVAVTKSSDVVDTSGLSGTFRGAFEVLASPSVFIGSLATFVIALILLAFDYINFELRRTTRFMKNSIGLHLTGKEGVGLDDLFEKVRDTNVLAHSFASGIVREYVAVRFTQTFAERLESVIKIFAIRHMNGFIPTLRSCRKIFDITTLELKDKYASKTHPSNNTESVRDLSDRLNTQGVSVVSIVDWFEINFAAEIDEGYGEDHLERWFRVAPTLDRKPKGLETLLLEMISPHVLLSVDSWNNIDLRTALQHCRLDYSYPVQTMEKALQLARIGRGVREIDWINGSRMEESEIVSVFKSFLGDHLYVNDPVAKIQQKDIVGLKQSERTTFKAKYDNSRWSDTSLGTPGYFVAWLSADKGWHSVFIELDNFFRLPPEADTTAEEKKHFLDKQLKKLRSFYPYADEHHAKTIENALTEVPTENNQAVLGCYIADPGVIRAVASKINAAISGEANNADQKIYIMYVASWLYPSERPIFEMQPKYFGDLDWIAFFNRDAVEPHVSLYGVNLSLDGKPGKLLLQSGQTGVAYSKLKGVSDGDGASLLTTSDTIMCFWKPEADDNDIEKAVPANGQPASRPQNAPQKHAAE